jgi:Methylene-tetrahydrofolate reductase C terminal.
MLSRAKLDAQFLGILGEQATWTEKCIGCGECMLTEFGGVCPLLSRKPSPRFSHKFAETRSLNLDA